MKSPSKEDQEYVMQKEREMVGILERVISNSYANVLDEKNVKLVANNVYVQGQMWGFRRWLIQKEFTLQEYMEMQFQLLKSQLAFQAN